MHVKTKMFSQNFYKYKTNNVRDCRLGRENTLKVASSELYLGSLIPFVTGGHKCEPYKLVYGICTWLCNFSSALLTTTFFYLCFRFGLWFLCDIIVILFIRFNNNRVLFISGLTRWARCDWSSRNPWIACKFEINKCPYFLLNLIILFYPYYYYYLFFFKLQ